MDPSTLAPAAIIQAIVVWLIQWLKGASWFKPLAPHTATLNRVVAFAVALAQAAGVTWHWNQVAGQLVISGLMWATIEQGIWTALAALVTNELVYMGVQIKQQALSTARVVGAPPIAEPPPVPQVNLPKP